jgi:hypothetical protein
MAPLCFALLIWFSPRGNSASQFERMTLLVACGGAMHIAFNSEAIYDKLLSLP